MLAPEQALYPAVDELIKPDRLAAGRVKHFARHATGRPGDDGAKIRLLDKRIHVDTPHDFVDIDAIDYGAYIDAIDYGAHVDAINYGAYVDTS